MSSEIHYNVCQSYKISDNNILLNPVCLFMHHHTTYIARSLKKVHVGSGVQSEKNILTVKNRPDNCCVRKAGYADDYWSFANWTLVWCIISCITLDHWIHWNYVIALQICHRRFLNGHFLEIGNSKQVCFLSKIGHLTTRIFVMFFRSHFICDETKTFSKGRSIFSFVMNKNYHNLSKWLLW